MLVVILLCCVVATAAQFDPAEHKNWNLLDHEICGDSTAARIIGGKAAQLGEFPWVARIGYSQPMETEISYRCGGAILNKNTILTAAHCVMQLPTGFKVAEIILGELNEKTDPDCENDVCASPIKKLRPIEIVYHSEYNRMPFQNDIALIRVDEEIEYNSYVRPICVPKSLLFQQDFVGNITEVAGWGIIDIETDDTSHILLKVNLQVKENNVCKEAFKSLAPIGEKQMCVGGEAGQDSCGGDSGGPLMLVAAQDGPPRVYIIGIVSFGSKRCGASTTPGVYTRITAYTEWILDNLQQNQRDFKLV